MRNRARLPAPEGYSFKSCYQNPSKSIVNVARRGKYLLSGSSHKLRSVLWFIPTAFRDATLQSFQVMHLPLPKKRFRQTNSAGFSWERPSAMPWETPAKECYRSVVMNATAGSTVTCLTVTPALRRSGFRPTIPSQLRVAPSLVVGSRDPITKIKGTSSLGHEWR